jgi:hypothetical protein
MSLPLNYVRTAVHAHNGLRGKVAWAQTSMKNIMQSPTATELAKIEANYILIHLDKLADELKIRDDSSAS